MTNGDDFLQLNRIDKIAPGVMSLLVGRQPPPAPSEPIRTIFFIVLATLVLQLLGIARSAMLLRRWRGQPALRPRGILRMGLRVMLNLLWAVVCLVGVPRLFGSSLSVIVFYDVGLVVLLSGAVALGWGMFLRPALVFLVLRKRGKDTGAPKNTGVSVNA